MPAGQTNIDKIMEASSSHFENNSGKKKNVSVDQESTKFEMGKKITGAVLGTDIDKVIEGSSSQPEKSLARKLVGVAGETVKWAMGGAASGFLLGAGYVLITGHLYPMYGGNSGKPLTGPELQQGIQEFSLALGTLGAQFLASVGGMMGTAWGVDKHFGDNNKDIIDDETERDLGEKTDFRLSSTAAAKPAGP